MKDLGVLIEHQLLFKLRLQLIQAQTMDDGDIDVFDLMEIL